MAGASCVPWRLRADPDDKDLWVDRLCYQVWIKAAEYARFRQKALRGMVGLIEDDPDDAAHDQPVPRDQRILAAEFPVRATVGDVADPDDMPGELPGIADDTITDRFNTDWEWPWLMVEFGSIIRDISPVIARFYSDEASPQNRLAGQPIASIFIEHGFAGTMGSIGDQINPLEDDL